MCCNALCNTASLLYLFRVSCAVRSLKFRISLHNRGNARTTLSTIVILACFAVRDIGFKSTVTTSLPIFRSASHRSPSSSGTKDDIRFKDSLWMHELPIGVDIGELRLGCRHQHIGCPFYSVHRWQGFQPRLMLEQMFPDSLFPSRLRMKDVSPLTVRSGLFPVQ